MFLKTAGATAVASAILISCKKKENDPTPSNSDSGVNLGSGDTGILNYAYALEQLEAAFYIQVVANAKFTTIFNASEQKLLKDIKAHEIVHRNFLKAALGTSAIQDLEVNFSSIDFGSKASVLGTAKAFEDLGVSAYNGAGQLISNTANGLVYLGLAGKIVSVEARHAAAIRDLLNPKSADFAGDDVVDPATNSGLDKQRSPSQVLAIAGTYIKTKINASNLPTA
ncbi:MAG: ferritin-like domain-containing protein [Cytophagales bacterium]|nr:ferritin-like domain-containing protein [Cytophaga sp.]